MGKTDRAEPTEKAPQGGDKSYNNRHQGFRQSEDTTGERGEKASGGLKGGDRHQGFKSGEASEATKVEGENRPGSGGIPEADVLSKAGEEPDKGDLTRAGREFQKHGSRRPEIWGQPIGNAEALNKSGQERLDTIINSSDTQWSTRHHARFGNVVEGQLSDGSGARWSANGKRLECFLDPPRT